MFISILNIIIGFLLLLKLSPYVVKYSVKLGKALNINPMIIGIITIAIGTSIPEITNSIVSSVSGHADINIGGSIGSALSQISLILGICILIGGKIRTERKNMFILGSALILSSIISYYVISKGNITRIEGLFLIIVYGLLYYLINSGITKEEYVKKEEEKEYVFSAFWWKYLIYIMLSISIIIMGSILLVNGVISISATLGIPEYLISFLVISVGTSLPELFVGLNALKKGEHELFIGDILGSNITDLTLSLGAGAIVKPNYFISSIKFIIPTTEYMIIVTSIIVLIFGIKKKLGRKEAILFIALYFGSYFFIS